MKLLTSREREIVLTLASGGLSNKDVGRRLNLSEGTVKVHLHNIYQKLGVKHELPWLCWHTLNSRRRLRGWISKPS